MMYEENVYIGVDVGGSHVAVGLVNDEGALIYTEEQPIEGNTQMEPTALVSLIVELISQVMDEFQSSARASISSDAPVGGDVVSSPSWWWNGYSTTLSPKTKRIIRGVGVGMPGQSKNGVLVAASNFPLFKNVPIVDMLHGYTFLSEIPIILVNDGDAAVAAEKWAEKSKHAYENAQNVAMITLGTGIGVGLVLNGRLFQGSFGCVEGGHMIVDSSPTATLCGCGQRGCVEVYASAGNISRIYLEHLATAGKSEGGAGEGQTTAAQNVVTREKMTEENKSDLLPLPLSQATHAYTSTTAAAMAAMRPLSLVEKEGLPSASHGGSKHVFKIAAADPESIAAHTLDVSCRYLALMCVNLCRVVDPSVIIIGGGMSKAGEPLLSRIRQHIQALTWTVLPTDVEVVLAQGLENAGIVGAALASKDFSQYSGPMGSTASTVSSSASCNGTSQSQHTGFSPLCMMSSTAASVESYLKYLLPLPPGWSGWWGICPLVCVSIGYMLSSSGSSSKPRTNASVSRRYPM